MDGRLTKDVEKYNKGPVLVLRDVVPASARWMQSIRALNWIQLHQQVVYGYHNRNPITINRNFSKCCCSPINRKRKWSKRRSGRQLLHSTASRRLRNSSGSTDGWQSSPPDRSISTPLYKCEQHSNLIKFNLIKSDDNVSNWHRCTNNQILLKSNDSKSNWQRWSHNYNLIQFNRIQSNDNVSNWQRGNNNWNRMKMNEIGIAGGRFDFHWNEMQSNDNEWKWQRCRRGKRSFTDTSQLSRSYQANVKEFQIPHARGNVNK